MLKTLKRLRNMTLIILAAALVIVSLIINRQPQVSVNSQTYHPSKTYVAAVNQQFAQLRNRNKITLNQSSLAEIIKTQFPEVDQVDINLPLYAKTATVKLKIAAPTFALTGVSADSGQRLQYTVAANGKAVGLAKDYPGLNGLPTLTDESDYPVKIGSVVLGKGTSNFILAVIVQCQKFNVPVASFDLANNSQEVDLRTKDKPYYVKFNLLNDPATQIGQFMAARAQFAKSGDPAEYLDVRVDGRIYYK